MKALNNKKILFYVAMLHKEASNKVHFIFFHKQPLFSAEVMQMSQELYC